MRILLRKKCNIKLTKYKDVLGWGKMRPETWIADREVTNRKASLIHVSDSERSKQHG